MVKVLISRDDKAKNFDLPEYATQGSSGVDLRAREDYKSKKDYIFKKQ